jgi:flagellin
MTSILTNVAANTALLNLQNTVNNLQNVQNQISTGLRVSSAADNAAYFSIATVLRSDSSALSTVSDALNLGGSSLDVASSAISKINTTLSDIKNQLLAATSPGVDRNKIQQQISQDQAQLKNIAASANFNGQNFLSVDSSATGYNSTKEFISSFSRDAVGAISVGTIAVNTATTALFDAGYTGVQPTPSSSGSATATAASINASPPAGTSGTVSSTVATTLTAYSAGTLSAYHYVPDANTAGSVMTNSVTVTGANSGTSVSVTAVGGAVNAAGLATNGDTANAVATSAAYKASQTGNTLTFYVAEKTTSNATASYQYFKYTVTGLSGGVLDSVDHNTVGTYTDALGNVTSSSASGTGSSIFNINISARTDSAADQAKLNAFQKQVDAAISNVTASASALGTARSRITSQSSFVMSLQTSLNNGVGSLVDADLNVASTRLQALQVQQQLGVQSLSIANQSTQSILKLFQ